MRRTTLLIVLLLALTACAANPHTVTMSTGSFKRVGNGRAELWLGIVDAEWRDNLGRLAGSAEVELECNGEVYFRVVYQDKFSEPACGVQVRLVEALDKSPPAARLEIKW